MSQLSRQWGDALSSKHGLRFGRVLLRAVAAVLLSLCASVAPAAVTVVADSGNPLTNGVSFQDALNAADCGDTIVLQAGVVYRSADSPDQPFRFTAKTTPACMVASPAWIDIRSSAADSLPEGVRVSLADESRMAIVDTAHSWGPVEFQPGAHHYRFVGILFTTAPTLSGQARYTNVLVSVHSSVGEGPWPHHLVFDRCMARPFEATTGEPFRSAARAFQVDGQDVWITNSYVYGFTGYSTDQPKVPIATATAAATPVLTSAGNHNYGGDGSVFVFGGTGNWVRANGIHRAEVASPTSIRIHKLIGLVTVTGSTARVRMYMNRVHNLQVNDRVTLAGFQSQSSGLNGTRTITAVTSVYEFDVDAGGATVGTHCPSGGPSCMFSGNAGSLLATWDASDAGPFTGNAPYFRGAVPPNSGAIYIIGSLGPHYVVNNYLEGWFATIFLGGGGLVTSNTATLSGASPTQAVFSNVANLKVGDLLALQVPDGWRTVKVSAIQGNLVSYGGFGSSPLGSLTPSMPGSARWRGVNGPYVIVRRNTLNMPEDQQYVGICKTFTEIKLVDGGVFDGNIYTGSQICPVIGVTSRNQYGATPWGVTRNLTYTNNLALAGQKMNNSEDDEYHTQVTAVDAPADGGSGGGDNMRYINNLILGVPAGEVPIMIGGTGPRSEFRHNTITTRAATRIGGAAGCIPSATPPFGIVRATVADNVVEHGDYGFVSRPGGLECWPTRASQLVNNVVVDTKGLGASQVNASVPGNLYAADYGAVQMAGTCDEVGNNWENCRLAPGSPFKGRASDGGDPGADIDTIRDHINGWSEAAGLILLTNENNPAAFQTGPDRTVIKLQTVSGACTLELFTDKARTQLHRDTDTASEQACSRAGNKVNADGTVEFALGTNETLTPATTYYYRIADGARTMVGSFRTTGGPRVPAAPGAVKIVRITEGPQAPSAARSVATE
jgi:hypothetical protein